MTFKMKTLLSLLITLTISQYAQARTVVEGTETSQSTIVENRFSGVVSKITDKVIIINAVSYAFAPNKVRVYDLNGRINQKAEIKVGMFVNYLFDKNKLAVLEIRLVRK